MHIVMLGQKGVPSFSGGIERHVESLAMGLVKRGHKVTIYGRRWYVGQAEAPEGILQRFSVGIRTKHLDAITHSFTALLDARKIRPDVIHLHGSGVALLTPFARLLHPGSKIVVTLHCPEYQCSKWNRFAKQMFKLGDWLACHFAHKIITVSQELAEYFLRHYGCQASFITHAFSMPSISEDETILEKHGLRKHEYLLFVGRLIPRKQAHALIDAYSVARRTYPDLFANIPLVLIGGGAYQDSYVRWLYAKAANEPGVIMLGERVGKELQVLQAQAVAHVFPTVSEGLSLAVIEAAAFARPIVSSDIRPNDEAHGGFAVRVRTGDVDDLAKGLVKILSLQKDEAQKMADNAHAFVCRQFHAQDRIDDVVRLYQEVLTGDSTLVTPYFA